MDQFTKWLQREPATTLTYTKYQKMEHLQTVHAHLHILLKTITIRNAVRTFLHAVIDNTRRAFTKNEFAQIEEIVHQLTEVAQNPNEQYDTTTCHSALVHKQALYKQKTKYVQDINRWSHDAVLRSLEKENSTQFDIDTRVRIMTRYVKELPKQDTNVMNEKWDDDTIQLYHRVRLYELHTLDTWVHGESHIHNQPLITPYLYTQTTHPEKPYAPYNGKTQEAFVRQLYKHAKTQGIAYIGIVDAITDDITRRTKQSQNRHVSYSVLFDNTYRTIVEELTNNTTINGEQANNPKAIASYLYACASNDNTERLTIGTPPYTKEQQLYIMAQEYRNHRRITHDMQTKQTTNPHTHMQTLIDHILTPVYDPDPITPKSNTRYMELVHELAALCQTNDDIQHLHTHQQKQYKTTTPLLIPHILTHQWLTRQIPHDLEDDYLYNQMLQNNHPIEEWSSKNVARFIDEIIAKKIKVLVNQNPYVKNRWFTLLLHNIKKPHITTMILEEHLGEEHTYQTYGEQYVHYRSNRVLTVIMEKSLAKETTVAH